MTNCILINPSGDVLHAIKASGGIVIDHKEYDVMVKVPKEWVIPEDFPDSEETECDGTHSDFIREFDVKEADTSKVTPRLLIPAPHGMGLPTLIWEWYRNGIISETCVADMWE